MQIANDGVVSINFDRANDCSELLDRSRDGQPLVYLHGISGILPSLEAALRGKSPGGAFEVHIASAGRQIEVEVVQTDDAIEVNWSHQFSIRRTLPSLTTLAGIHIDEHSDPVS